MPSTCLRGITNRPTSWGVKNRMGLAYECGLQLIKIPSHHHRVWQSMPTTLNGMGKVPNRHGGEWTGRQSGQGGGTDLGKRGLMDLVMKTVIKYTRCRMTREPFRAWGKTLGRKGDDACEDCTLGQEHTDTGTLVPFQCKKYNDLSRDLLGTPGARRSWTASEVRGGSSGWVTLGSLTFHTVSFFNLLAELPGLLLKKKEKTPKTYTLIHVFVEMQQLWEVVILNVDLIYLV